jgi:hypothetical protein
MSNHASVFTVNNYYILCSTPFSGSITLKDGYKFAEGDLVNNWSGGKKVVSDLGDIYLLQPYTDVTYENNNKTAIFTSNDDFDRTITYTHYSTHKFADSQGNIYTYRHSLVSELFVIVPYDRTITSHISMEE